MGLQKNVASQKWRVFAFDTTDGTAKTGDAANITAKIAKDWAAAGATNDVNPTEVEDGYYLFDLTQAETNADALDLYPESSTANIQVIGVPGSQGTRVVQTGDSFARLGAPAGASIAADIADVPTVSEFNARTILSASYFDPAADTVANVTLVATTTTNTDMVAEAPTAAVNAAAVWDLDATAHQTLGTFGKAIGDPLASTETIFNTLNVAPAGANLAVDIADIPTVAEFDARTLVAASYFDPAADTVANVTTVATLTSHTPQTGDSFARLGAPAGASISVDIADLPTVSEFNARTILSASYFDPAADAVANVTLVATTTTLTGHTVQTGDSFVKVNQLTFTVANRLDVNTRLINGAIVVGDGNVTPWDGA